MATATTDIRGAEHRFGGVQIPIAVWMLLASLALGLLHGLNAPRLIATVNSGFGAALGEYALILLPSFVIAHAVTKSKVSTLAEWMPALLAPVAGAAMVCPDTAYAALGPMARRRKLSVLFGAYAGFKLLVPAGPLIVATGLGALDARLALVTLPVFTAAWLTGLIYARAEEGEEGSDRKKTNGRLPLQLLSPLMVLAGLLVAGLWLNSQGRSLPAILDFCVSPKGALLVAAVVALLMASTETRGEAVQSAAKRTAPLLLTIGAASALGTMITQTLPIARWASLITGTGLVLPALFAFTAVFKTAKGSSMATFAGATGIVVALLPALGVSPAAAALVMCSGAFVTIAPNDSLYWIVHDDVKEHCPKLGRKLAIGAALQGFVALATVELMNFFGLL